MLDWRVKNRNLYKTILKTLHVHGYEIFDGQSLSASKKYISDKKNAYKIILEFPSCYPDQIISAHLSSKELFSLYIKRPIKHLMIIDQDILNVCLKGAWNNLDFCDVPIVEREVIKWISDYENNEQFPDDFDLPENTLFFPQLQNAKGILIYDYFLKLDIFKDSAFGTYEIVTTNCSNVGLLTTLNVLGNDSKGAIFAPQTYSLPDKDELLNKLFNGAKRGIIKGLWQSSDTPPSPLAVSNKQIKLPLSVQEYVWKEIIQKKDGNPFIAKDTVGYLFFFDLFNKHECIFLLLKDTDNVNEAIQKCQYLKPFIINDQTFWGRAGGLLDSQKFNTLKICVLGAGAIGSQCAEELIRLGVPNITLIDKEKLIPENVMRHAADISFINFAKSDALKYKLEKINPNAHITSIPQDVLSNELDFSKLDSDLYVSAVADDKIERFINRTMIQLNKPTVYGRTTSTSYGCRVFRVRPKIDACFECLKYFSYFQDMRYVSLTDENLAEKADLIKFRGCTAPSYIGVNMDIRLYANLLSRCVFDTLHMANDKYVKSLEPANHFIYLTREVAEEPKLKAHLLYKHQFLPLSGCSVCGSPDLPYNGILVMDAVINKIRDASHSSKKNETGGILIGTVLELVELEKTLKFLVVSHCTLPGKKAKKEPYFFDRDIMYCSGLLNEYHKKSSGILNYVGEWHSHPSEIVSPSSLDDSSLFKVAKDQGYKLDAPLSIIQSNASDNISFNVYYNEKKYSENPIITARETLDSRLGTKLIADLD